MKEFVVKVDENLMCCMIVRNFLYRLSKSLEPFAALKRDVKDLNQFFFQED